MKRHLLILVLISGLISYNKGQIITTVAGNGGNGFGGDGSTSTTAILSFPRAVAFDQAGNMYISDANNNRIRKVDLSGTISTFAGTNTSGYSGDGGQANLAKLTFPCGLAFDSSGNLYIADGGNHCVRKVTPAGIISTFAGTGTSGFSGDGGPATSAMLDYPYDVAIDASGNVYIADGNAHRIRKVNTLGNISTYAGNGNLGSSGDNGPATAAEIKGAFAIAFDASDNLFIADYADHRIRKVSSSGTITTFAGTGILGSSGDGGQAISATLAGPNGLTFDSMGNLYVSDGTSNNIRKIDNSGIITLFAGTGTAGYGGDGGPANQCQLRNPADIGLDVTGNLYIGDVLNHRVRKICLATSCVSGLDTEIENENSVLVFPNPNQGSFKVKIANEKAKFIIMNTIGQIVYEHGLIVGENSIELTTLPNGLYSFLVLSETGQKSSGKLVIN